MIAGPGSSADGGHQIVRQRLASVIGALPLVSHPSLIYKP